MNGRSSVCRPRRCQATVNTRVASRAGMYVRAVRAHLEEREHSGTANLHPTGPGVRERTAAEHRVRSRRQVLGCRPDKLVLQHRPQLFRGGQHIFHRGTSALHLRGSMGECMFAIIKSAAVNMNTDQAVHLSMDNLYNYWKIRIGVMRNLLNKSLKVDILLSFGKRELTGTVLQRISTLMPREWICGMYMTILEVLMCLSMEVRISSTSVRLTGNQIPGQNQRLLM